MYETLQINHLNELRLEGRKMHAFSGLTSQGPPIELKSRISQQK
jgi:hypothetical protein